MKKNLIADLDSHAGKMAYRSYQIKHGFELIEVLIPLAETTKFEEQMKQPLKNRTAVLDVVQAVGGMLK